jgi:D-3-phosphoglycerate dehydrogenase / 2-oxoglutarate reductase
MKIKILINSSALKEILLAKLNEVGLTDSDIIDYNQPLLPQLVDADVIVNDFSKIDKTVIDACPNLRLVHQIGIGFDNVDVGYCTSKSIYVANVPLANADSVAEHTMFLLLYLAKNMNGTSTTSICILERRIPGVLGSELQGKTIIIIGLGATGLEVAKRAKSFGMHVVAVTKNPSLKKPGFENKEHFVDSIGGLETLSESLSQADYVSLHTPLTDETRSMIGKKELSLMKKSSFLINVARATIVDREALFTELSSKKISGAAFDVFWEEPADSNDKLLKLDNFVLTPHIAGWTHESVDDIARIITTNIERISQAQVPLTIVNSELTY